MSGYQTVDPARLRDDQPQYTPGLSRLSVLQSVRRHPFLTILPIVLVLGAAVAYSVVRTPVYTAESRMTVTRLDLSQPGALNGFAAATQALATAYSRTITAQDITQTIAAKTNLDPLEVRSRLSSTPIPESPLFKVEATGTTAAQAIEIANSASEALRSYVNRSAAGPRAATKDLLRTYRDRQKEASAASLRLDNARRIRDDSPTAANRKAVSAAEADYAAARLQADVSGTAYTASASAGSSIPGVDVLTPATSASNDRRTQAQIYAFVALVIGAFLGAALATLTEDRRYRRALRSSVR